MSDIRKNKLDEVPDELYQEVKKQPSRDESVKTEEFKSSLSSFLNALHSIFEKSSKAPDGPYANTEKIPSEPKEAINFTSFILSTSQTTVTTEAIATSATTASNQANIRPTTNASTTLTKILSSKTAKFISSTDTESKVIPHVTEIPNYDLILPDACLCSMNDLPKIEGLSKWDCDEDCNCLPKCFSGKIIPEGAVCSRVSKMLHRSYFGSDPGKTYALAGDQHLHFPKVRKLIFNTQNV